MIRMHMPSGTNQDPGAKFRRTTSEAFLCDATEAGVIQHFPKKKRYGRWVAVVILGVVLTALFGCAKPQPQPIPVSQEHVIPEGVCAKGDVGIWLDETTVQCVKEKK